MLLNVLVYYSLHTKHSKIVEYKNIYIPIGIFCIHFNIDIELVRLLLSTTIRQVELTQTRSSSILETVAWPVISLQRQMFGRLAPSGIMGAQARAIPETPRTILNRGV